MPVIMHIVSGLISVYMILIFVRVLLTWFQGPSYSRPIYILGRATDPYLNLFRRLSFLRTERIDFSPILALIVLVILLNVTQTIASFGTITFGIILALVIQALWSATSFVLIFLLALDVIRLIGELANVNSVSPFWHTLDIILQPVLVWTGRVILRSRPVTYRTVMIFAGVLMLAAVLIGGWVIARLTTLAGMIPF